MCHWGTEAQRRDDVSGGGLITHLTMWAENDEGLVNLIKASSVANLEGRVMRYPRMDKEVLATYSKGVIASSGCPSGIIQTRLRLGQFEEALRAAGEFQDIFGKDNFFIELMDHGLTIETQVTNDLLTIAKKLDAPLLATNDSHYVHAEDAQAQDAMLCINSGSRLDRSRTDSSSTAPATTSKPPRRCANCSRTTRTPATIRSLSPNAAT